MSEDTRLFLFVYAKDGKVRVLTHDEACGNEVRMKQDGWKHTATITAGPKRQVSMSLRSPTTTP